MLKQCSLAGHAEFRSRHPLLLGNPLAVDMLIDVLTDRGFSAAHTAEERVVPKRFDLRTGEVDTATEEVHCFRITFDKENVRDLTTPASVVSKHSEDIAIGTTFVPEHLRRDEGPIRRRFNALADLGNFEEDVVKHPCPKTAEYNGSLGDASATHADGAEGPSHRRTTAPPAWKPSGSSEEVSFLRGWDSMDAELNAAVRERQYGYELMNDRED